MADKEKIQRSGKAKWTFLVYMTGDNNLDDGAALREIAGMAKAGFTRNVHILVQLDRIEDQKTRRFRITQGGGFKKDCIEAFSETNTGDPQILYNFAKWAVDNYPADRYALCPLEPRQRLVGGCQKPGRRSCRQETAPVPDRNESCTGVKRYALDRIRNSRLSNTPTKSKRSLGLSFKAFDMDLTSFTDLIGSTFIVDPFFG